MSVVAYDKETFLLITGLEVPRQVSLVPGLELRPAQCTITGEMAPQLTKNHVDLAVYLLFLPRVRSELRVGAENGESLAMAGWNALWDVGLLGALFGYTATCNIQSEVSATELGPQSWLHVTNYHLHGYSREGDGALTEDELKWLERHYATARTLLAAAGFQNAVHSLFSFRWHSNPRARLAVLWSGIEGLFGIHSEMAFRLSLYISRFLAPTDERRRREIFSRVKNLYGRRSAAVHGAKLKGSSGVAESAEILVELVRACVVAKSLPSLAELAP